MTDPFAGLSPEQIHSAGATVHHVSPFSTIEVPLNLAPLEAAFIERWIRPFYQDCLGQFENLEGPLRTVYHSIDEALVCSLLAFADWRPRLTGAIFAALRRLTGLTDHLGRLLLRSDVCYAGDGYCLALARFGTPACVTYLQTYLDYYLRQPHLFFDQGMAMSALTYLDVAHQTNHAVALKPLWVSFVANKPHWDLAQDQERFAQRMVALDILARRCDQGAA
jgi:uncharacterized protein DUF6000